MACKMSAVHLKFLDREEPVALPLVESCEELWRLAGRKILGVKKPAALEIFGIKSNGLWLSPSARVPTDDQKLEFRLRFKTPHPVRLKEIDLAAFRYYYRQVRHDLDNGLVLKDIAKDNIKDINAKSARWYVPIINNRSDPETNLARKKRVKLLSTIVYVVSLNIVIDVLTEEIERDNALKELESYLPKEIWVNTAEKFIGLRELKQTSSRLVDKFLADKHASVDTRKMEFLARIEADFPEYFEELFAVNLRYLESKQVERVTLKIVPPFKKHNSSEENEAYLARHLHKAVGTTLCKVEEICNISTSKKDQSISIEIARKNGIPLYLVIDNPEAAWSFLTSLTGYYRLCEKWIFCLCPDIIYPSLNSLLMAKVHGPVDTQFVKEKFKASPERQQLGTFLIRRSCDNHFTFFLHYVIVSSVTEDLTERSLGTVHIIQSEETGSFSVNKQDVDSVVNLQNVEDCYNDLASLVKDISGPLGLKTCLHPSEYDRAPTLLLCRSDTALKNDIIGQDNRGTQQKEFIPLSALSKCNEKVLKGRFTKIWKARWAKNSREKEVVAVKQLKYTDNYLPPFMHMCYYVMLWNDPSLVKIHGAILATPTNPMALVMEYLPLGPLTTYLQKMKQDVEKDDLLEAAVSLARALLHLEELQIVHGNIRLRNVLVAQHEGAGLKVKLSDPGLADYSQKEEVHWLALELLLDSCPTASKCTSKGDVWAFATTLWELFSYGEAPSLDPVFVKEQYLNGYRLKMPKALHGEFSSIYGVMQGCWSPSAEARNAPHTILRDLNQLLYKVCNSKKVHTYVTVNESNCSTPVQSDRTGNVIYLSSEENSLASRSPDTMASRNHLSYDSSDENLQNFGHMPITSNTLAPLFTLWTKQHFGVGGLGHGSSSESHQNLIMDSRSASSMDGSVVNSFRSQFTMQTSISSLSTLTSQYSVYQINEDQISLNKDRPLGEGNFGIVYKGVWNKSNGEWEEVAVKMLKDFNDPASEEEIERELNLMRRLDHENIVRIHGAFSVADTGNTAFAMEFVREGSLDNYLRTHKNHIRVPHQLFIFADNICDGMIYLSREGIIHRDLAARNILVASDERVKISDFGLARQPQGKDYYTMSSHTNIPVKWMAIESLIQGIFHTPSDVWSFGTVLWEMFTFGESPYIEGCEDFFKADQTDDKVKAQMEAWIQKLHEGARFPMPEACPSALYSQVMLQCWEYDCNNRPSFNALQHQLRSIEKQVT